MKNDRKDNLPNEMIPVYIGTGLLMLLDIILNLELYFPFLLMTGVFIAYLLLLHFIKRWKAAKTDQTEEIDEVDAEFELHKDVRIPLLVIVFLIYKYMEQLMFLDIFFNHELYFPFLLSGVFIGFRLLLDFIKRWKAAKTDQTEEIDKVDAKFELHKAVWFRLLVIVFLIYKYMERKSVLDTFFFYAAVVLAVYLLIAIVRFYVKRHRNATIQEDGASGTPEE